MHKTLLAVAAALLSTSAMADTLVHNANGIQGGADGKLQRFGALLVGDDGKVMRTFTAGEALPAQVTERIDAGGRTLLPGLIDGHGHFFGLGFSALTLDLTGSASLADLQQRLAAYAAQNPGSGWVVGRGWNQELWPDARFPTAADLESVVAGRPVALERVDGHALVANSAALRAAGITNATPDPVGGKIERDSAGNATGLLIDSAMALVTAKVPAATATDRERALDEAQRLLLGFGVTAVGDMGTSVDEWQALRRAADAGRLNVRIMAYAAGMETVTAIGRPSVWLNGDRLRMVGVKLYDDGALGSRGAWLKRPYADKPDTRGLQFLKDAELQAQVNSAAGKGFQVAVHAIGDAANAQAIGAFEQAGKAYPGDRRWRIEHVQIIDPADIPRLAPAGIIASMQPTHQTSDRTMAEKRLDPPRLQGAYAWQSMLRSGARLAFGSDFPVESPNPFPGLGAAISRQDANGQPPGGWFPAQRLTFAQALHGFTRGAAYAGFAEAKIGALEAGKWADFIIVDRDVSAVEAQTVYGTQVLETWVAGKKVWARSATAPGERG
ncbi:MAG: amidohydrolase [Sphingomonas sp.]|nr:amidohydrolase [Sphingomonas sp.]